MKNSITIDKGQKKYKDGKVVFKWDFTLSEEGDYETGTIKYHELIYDIDKTSAVIGEEENEKWITINKRDCKSIPTLDFFEYFHLYCQQCSTSDISQWSIISMQLVLLQ